MYHIYVSQIDEKIGRGINKKIKDYRALRMLIIVVTFVAINVGLYCGLNYLVNRPSSTFLRYDTNGSVSMSVLSDGINTIVIDTYGTRESVRQLGSILLYGKKFISLIIISNLDSRSIEGVPHIIRAYDVGAIVLPKQDKINKRVEELIDDANSYSIPVLSVKDQSLFTFQEIGAGNADNTGDKLKIQFERNAPVLINEKIHITNEIKASFISNIIKAREAGKLREYILFSKKEPTFSSKQEKLWQANLPKMAVYGTSKQREKGLRQIAENKDIGEGMNASCKLSVKGMFGFISFKSSGEIESVRCGGG